MAVRRFLEVVQSLGIDPLYIVLAELGLSKTIPTNRVPSRRLICSISVSMCVATDTDSVSMAMLSEGQSQFWRIEHLEEMQLVTVPIMLCAVNFIYAILLHSLGTRGNPGRRMGKCGSEKGMENLAFSTRDCLNLNHSICISA